MSIVVLIERRLKPGQQEKFRTALRNPRLSRRTVRGFVSGKVIHDASDENNTLVISVWERLEDWQQWQASAEREALNQEIQSMLDGPEVIRVYQEYRNADIPLAADR